MSTHLNETTMQTTMEAVSGRLTAATREALYRYPWPKPTRIAGYVVIGTALLALLAHESVYHQGAIAATIALTAVILAGYHLLSGGKPRPRWHPNEGLALVAIQTVCAVAIEFMVDGQSGAIILLYLVAAELQFLVSFQAALLGAVGLWLLCWGTGEWTAAGLSGLGSPQVVLSNGATTFCGFVFVAAVTHSAVIEVMQRHQATILLDELNATHAQLQSYVSQVEGLTVARERNRLAREIHDTLGHYLTVINVQIETAQKLAARDPGRSQAALATAKTLASECLAEVRRSVEALRPAALDGVALPEAIARLVDDLRRASGVTIHVQGQGVGTLSPAAEVAVYRVIQEALTNVRKHAEARNVWLSTEWGPVWFTASVRDDGCGAVFQPHNGDATAPGFGLHGMRERVDAVGGTLEVNTAPGAGFRVQLRVPCLPGPSTAPAPRHHASEAPVP